jgi:2-desacetyl-2-hydroxyethyl bacteriochlorophyllide A dehydrogenase
MKAAQYQRPHILQVITKDLGSLGEDDVLVSVEACGVCGTDVHIVEGTSRSTPPVVLGHEFAGQIVAVGNKVKGLEAGQRVAVDPNISCGVCYYCRRGLIHLCSHLQALGVDIDGGMAEYCLVPARQAYVLPAEMSAEVCAFVEPVSCVVHGIDKANIRPGDTVVILGGGTIGLIMLQLVQQAGAAYTIVLEPLEQKRRTAQALGATLVVDPMKDEVRGIVLDVAREGADVIIECVGKPATMELAIDLARRGGTVEFFGVCPIGATILLEPNKVYFKELTIVGSYVNPNTFSRSISLLQSGKVRVDKFEINRFPLDGVHEALRYQREGLTMKSVIMPQQ